jgi:hypothetical protein
MTAQATDIRTRKGDRPGFATGQWPQPPCESGGRTALKAVQGLSAKQRQIMDLGDEGVKRPKPDEGSDNDTDAKG